MFGGSVEAVQRRDALKEELARSKDLTLIVVPCWWDGTTGRCVYIPFSFLEFIRM